MPLFELKNGRASKLDPTALGREKQIQTVFEANLPTLLAIDFVKTEHITSGGGRIDTLGIDKDGSPVIIEYKKTQNDNVINQGLSYLRWLLDHKADFVQLCKMVGIERNIDWTSPRVICVAGNYNKFDLDTADFLPIKIELLKYTVYGSNLLHIDRESQEPVRTPTSQMFEKGKKNKGERAKLQTDYTVEAHLSRAGESTKQTFLGLRERIMALDKSIVEEPKAQYIAYKMARNFVDVVMQKGALKIYLNMPSGKLNDPGGFARNLEIPKHVGHWGNGDYQVDVKNQEDVDKVFGLIQQSYNYNK